MEQQQGWYSETQAEEAVQRYNNGRRGDNDGMMTAAKVPEAAPPQHSNVSGGSVGGGIAVTQKAAMRCWSRPDSAITAVA